MVNSKLTLAKKEQFFHSGFCFNLVIESKGCAYCISISSLSLSPLVNMDDSVSALDVGLLLQSEFVFCEL